PGRHAQRGDSMASSPTDVTFREQGKQKPHQIATLRAEFIAAARAPLHTPHYDFPLTDAPAHPPLRPPRPPATACPRPPLASSAAVPSPARPGTADFVKKLGFGIQSRPITGGAPQMPKLMHHKYAVRDGRTPAGAVWTGSVNWTDDSWTLQENNIVRL